MAYLEISGASIYYEKIGRGPMLLCISGADGSCEIWRAMAESLKDHFTVVMWDRRGFSRSYLTGAQDYKHRLETDADDAARLIQEFSPSEPATVIGNSSGAIVSLKLLARHPALIRTLLPYEPPAARFCPDFDELLEQHHDIYNTYRQWGMPPAFEKFAKVTLADQSGIGRLMDPRNGQYLFSNLQYWFEREFMYYPQAEFDIGRELLPQKAKLVLVNGELTDHAPYQYRANKNLAEKLGLEVVHFPGEHIGHLTHAAQFAQKLLETLKEKDEYYTKL